MYPTLEDKRNMHENLEDGRKNAPNSRGRKEKCTELRRTEKNAQKSRGQKEKCTEF